MTSTNSSNINPKQVMMERQLYANKTPSRTNFISAKFLPESTKQDPFLIPANTGALLKFNLPTGTAMNVAELFCTGFVAWILKARMKFQL